MNKGKSSHNIQSSTKAYEQLVLKYGESPTEEQASLFIDEYIIEKNISVERYLNKYQEEWDSIADEYYKRAEVIFGSSLPQDVTAYFTINHNCPYSIPENYFFVTTTSSVRSIVMHELWHFYTWYGLGTEQKEKLGHEKYNEFKEALTVLLNVEFADLLPEGLDDRGYTQHAELRAKILELWNIEKDIHKLWNQISL